MMMIKSMAQQMTRRNQIIFAVFDVSLNNGPYLIVIKLLSFCINFRNDGFYNAK